MKRLIILLVLIVPTVFIYGQFDKLKFIYVATHVRNYDLEIWEKLPVPYIINLNFEKNVIELAKYSSSGTHVKKYTIISPTTTRKYSEGAVIKISKSWDTSREEYINPFKTPKQDSFVSLDITDSKLTFTDISEDSNGESQFNQVTYKIVYDEDGEVEISVDGRILR